MANVRIVTDSASDLPVELALTHGIVVVPLSIRFGGDEFVDRIDLTPKQFWSKVAASKVLPETAAPAPGAFEAAYRQAAEDGCDGVVVVTLSSKISATYGSAQVGARAVEGIIAVTVIDSLSVSMGTGTMAVEAAKLANAGAPMAEVEAAIRRLVGKTMVIFTLDTLENLKKGGRVGGAQALIGSLFSIKPILDLSTGAVMTLGKQRTRVKSLTYLASLVADAKAKYGVIEHLSVLHGDADDVDQILDVLAPLFPRDEIFIGQLGAVMGTHGGPGAVGIIFDVASSADAPDLSAGSGESPGGDAKG